MSNPKAYKWTSTPPTFLQLGHYWHRFSPSHASAIVEVLIEDGDLSVRTGTEIDSVNFIENYAIPGSEWAGPIHEPT